MESFAGNGTRFDTKLEMEIIKSLDECEKVSGSVVTIGTFDGIHLAHQKIIEQVVSLSRDKNLVATVVTFDPHPRFVISKNDGASFGLLTTTSEKTDLIAQLDVDRLVILPFTTEFSQTPPDTFIRDTLFKTIGFQTLIIGYDHGFGKNRAGDTKFLQKIGDEMNFQIIVQESIATHSSIISSTKIRSMVLDGNMTGVLENQGRPYCLTGTVVRGDGRGKTLNFPTANIRLNNDNKCIPGNGVYVVNVDVRGVKYQGAMNIGFRPTFDKDLLTLEVHLLDFNKTIYDEAITVSFLKQIRKEKKFDSQDILKKQIKSDINYTRSFFVESTESVNSNN